MKPGPDAAMDDVLADGLERALERAERSPAASEELDFLADLVAAAELERAHLARPAPLARPTFLVRPWLLAAAASVLFVLALGAWLFGGARDRDGARLAAGAPPRYVPSDLRAPDGPLAGDFARAMEPYARGEWSAAIEALGAFLARAPEHGPAHFYLAAAAEQLGELARAEHAYERAAASPDPLLAQHARFRLAQLWLARGEDERARAALQALIEGDGELVRNARELLLDQQDRELDSR